MFKKMIPFILCMAGWLTAYGVQADTNVDQGEVAHWLHGDSKLIQIMALSATSSQDPHFDLTSLLDSSAAKGWQPGISGTGAEEGVLVEFKNPVSIDEVQLKGTDTFNISVNGHEIEGKADDFKVNEDIKSLFIHVKADPSEASVLKGFTLLLGGKPVQIQKPMMVDADVKATNVLSPFLAYGPFHLFDSKIDMAFALDGKKNDSTKPIPLFDLKLQKTIGLKGFYIWNGYQRSEEHYGSNARPKKITVSNGNHTTQYVLKDVMGPQWVVFSDGGWDVSSLSFTADEIYPGSTYKDLVISEISFETKKDEIVLLNIEKPKLKTEAYLFLDKSLKSIPINGFSEFSLKFRTDGSFAAICEVNNDSNRNIWEGNWEAKSPNQVRVFGRHYVSYPNNDEGAYGTEVLKDKSTIFQSKFTIENLNKISTKEKNRIYQFEVNCNGGTLPGGNAVAFWDSLKDQPDAYFFESDLFSQIMVPDDFKK